MNKIPPDLVKSLTKLGLLESEAKIYIALVMMNRSEVKELIDFTGISKPNTYEGLRSLEELGLINAVSERPIVYQAVAPDIGLEILIDTHMKAKKDAAKLFSDLPRDSIEHPLDNMWFIFTDKNLEYKIKDLISNARTSVIFLGSDKYLKYLKPLARKDVRLECAIISETPDTEPTLRKMFGPDRANIQFINRAEVARMLSISRTMGQKELVPSLEEIYVIFNYDKMLIIVTDDSEMLYIPPFFDSNMGAMSSHSKILIENMKIIYKAMGTYFAGREADKK